MYVCLIFKTNQNLADSVANLSSNDTIVMVTVDSSEEQSNNGNNAQESTPAVHWEQSSQEREYLEGATGGGDTGLAASKIEKRRGNYKTTAVILFSFVMFF